MGDLTVIILAVLMVVLCWIIIKVNEKVDRYIMRFKKLERALLRNADGMAQSTDHQAASADNPGIPMAATHKDHYPDRQMIARSKPD